METDLMNQALDVLSGLSAIAVGIFCFLLAYGFISLSPKDPDKMEQWRRKYGRRTKAIGVLSILFGVALLIILGFVDL